MNCSGDTLLGDGVDGLADAAIVAFGESCTGEYSEPEGAMSMPKVEGSFNSSAGKSVRSAIVGSFATAVVVPAFAAAA
jgi:hypothetical protein